MSHSLTQDAVAHNSQAVPGNSDASLRPGVADAELIERIRKLNQDLITGDGFTDFLTMGRWNGYAVPLYFDNERNRRIPTHAEFQAIVARFERFYEVCSDEHIAEIEARNKRAVEAYRQRIEAEKKSNSKDKTSFVYLMEADGLHKIGISVNVEMRRKAIQNGLLKPVRLICAFDVANAKRVEGNLHRRFAQKRIEGEWYNLTPEDVEYIRGLSQ